MGALAWQLRPGDPRRPRAAQRAARRWSQTLRGALPRRRIDSGAACAARRRCRRGRAGGLPDRPGGAQQRAPARARRSDHSSSSCARRARSAWSSPTTAAASADDEREGPGIRGMRERALLIGGSAADRHAPGARHPRSGSTSPRQRARRADVAIPFPAHGSWSPTTTPSCARGSRRCSRSEPDLKVVARGRRRARGGRGGDGDRTIDLAILDVAMPGLTGLQAAREISRRRPDLPILILSMYDREQYFFEALAAGASGYVLKRQADQRHRRGLPGGAARRAVHLPAGDEHARCAATWSGPQRGERPGRGPLTAARERDREAHRRGPHRRRRSPSCW